MKMANVYIVTLDGVMAGSGWRTRGVAIGTNASVAYKKLSDMVEEGGDLSTPPSGASVSGPDVAEVMTWDRALAYHHLKWRDP